ncbi:hypothetical protein [Vibrio astriarenae]|uniref:hypothetical protein n=1 Tax=Vibrio astriarenae TaxID=1481923 RepID=UPI003736142E
MHRLIIALLASSAACASPVFYTQWEIKDIPECGLSVSTTGRINLDNEHGQEPVTFRYYDLGTPPTIKLVSYNLVNATASSDNILLGTLPNSGQAQPINSWIGLPHQLERDNTPNHFHTWLTGNYQLSVGEVELKARWEIECY